MNGLCFTSCRRDVYLILLLSALYIFACTHQAFSQELSQNSYIVNLEGDTISGLIHAKKNKLKLGKVYYKDQALRKEIIYTPSEIKAFFVKDKIYRSAVVETDIHSFSANNLPNAQAKQLKVDTLFIEVLISGKKSLSRMIDIKGKAHYLINDGNTFKDHHVILKKESYKNQLRTYLQDCPFIDEIISTSRYQYNSLLNVFNAYYGCDQVKAENIKRPEKFTIGIGLNSGSSSKYNILILHMVNESRER